MSRFLQGYVLVASNQAAITQKAKSFTLNWINMALYAELRHAGLSLL